MRTKSFIISALSIFLSCCSSPQSGPDKTIGGAILGAGWGAGAGAIVGNQVSGVGQGALAGAGMGALAGAMTGAGYDITEGVELEQERTLASLKIQNAINNRQLQAMQSKLDRAEFSDGLVSIYQVFFDADATNLKSGAISDLEVIADNIKTSARNSRVNVVGHSDDSGTPEYNQRLAEARARIVVSYLAARGVSMDRISLRSEGSAQPIASNANPEGRQLNRRVEVFFSR